MQIMRGMDTNILATIKKLLRSDKRSLQLISRESGIPFSTLRYIRTGSTKYPRFDTLMKLAAFLEKPPAKRNGGRK